MFQTANFAAYPKGEAILDMVQVACYFAYANRLAVGLGLELEDFYYSEEQIAEFAQPPHDGEDAP